MTLRFQLISYQPEVAEGPTKKRRYATWQIPVGRRSVSMFWKMDSLGDRRSKRPNLAI